jgi:AraC-like DNA-binding protein
MPAMTPPDLRTECTRPPAALASRVDFLLWQPPGTGGVFEHEVAPDTNPDLLIEVSDTHCRVVLYGPVTRLTRVQTRADCAYGVVHFHPGAMPRLVDASATELVDGTVELRQVAGLPVDALGEGLARAGSAEERRALLVGVLQRLSWPPPSTFDRALHQLVVQSPSPRVGELAEALHLSPRTLERAFRDRVGLTPRTFQRIQRLQSALAALRSDARCSIAEVAFASGYADHAHLTREFRSFIGCTPSDFRARS